MSADYLWHLTTTTGHGRRSYRNEVDPAVVTLVRQQLGEALAGIDVVVRDGYALTAKAVGTALVATVSGPKGTLVTIGVARKSRDAARLWQMLQSKSDAIGEMPRPPWCAVALHPAIAGDPIAATWLGDYERCLAWAWVDR